MSVQCGPFIGRTRGHEALGVGAPTRVPKALTSVARERTQGRVNATYLDLRCHGLPTPQACTLRTTKNRLSIKCFTLSTAGYSVVREGGVEPPRPFGHTDLNRARLPIPPLALVYSLGFRR